MDHSEGGSSVGATVCNQEEADRDIPKLLTTPAAKRFLSIEPMLGPIHIRDHWLIHHHPGDAAIDWAICGGESGPAARPIHPGWARSLRDQCAAAGVPFFFKQWGEWGAYYGAPAGAPGKFAAHWDETGRWAFFDEAPRQFWIFGADTVRQRVGKKAAGRLLDGVQHDAVPA